MEGKQDEVLVAAKKRVQSSFHVPASNPSIIQKGKSHLHLPFNRLSMTSPPMAAKRRRLNNASNTLSKPFVSPLKTDGASKTPTKNRRSDVTTSSNPPYKSSTLAHTINAASSTPSQKTQLNRPAITPVRSSSARRPAYSSPFAKRLDPAEQAVQKSITSLELQIKSVQNDIDALNQAAKYTNDGTDDDLEELALKWKLASQAAAEEIFGSVKERVNRMGGVEAWRDSEKQKYERSNGIGEFAEPEVEDDADCEFDSQGEELPEDEQEYRKKEKKRIRHEALEAADVDERVVEDPVGPKPVWQQKGNDDDSFTMDMMLQSLNIDLDVIGFDKAEQRWTT